MVSDGYGLAGTCNNAPILEGRIARNHGGIDGTAAARPKGVLVIHPLGVQATAQIGHGKHGIDHHSGFRFLVKNLFHDPQDSQHHNFFTALHATQVVHTKRYPPNTGIEIVRHLSVQQSPKNIGTRISSNAEGNALHAALGFVEMLLKDPLYSTQRFSLRPSHPTAIHLFHKRFSQKSHVEMAGAFVRLDQLLVDNVRLGPGEEFFTSGGFKGILTSTGIIVATQTPVVDLIHDQVIFGSDGGEIYLDLAECVRGVD
mmetsp:Transcript_10344/g.23932  ORF Transcript_10344/g.23932 Transcript_10344/m.23932 type:complete len:257 (-) Transcript_10344:186-956(-)